MQYRDFRRGEKVSLLGMGIMRVPMETVDGVSRPVQETANQLVKSAVEAGVTYFDSAYRYCGQHADDALGAAIRPYREKVLIATKLPISQVQRTEEFTALLDEQLQNLGMEKIDVYLMHNLRAKDLEKYLSLGLTKFLDDIQASGKVGRVAFSNHDDYEGFKSVVDSYDNWGMAQVQYNILDKHVQASIKGLDYAYEKNIPMVIMEGLRGGDLASAPPLVRDRYAKEGRDWSAVEWAFRFIADHPAVACILSGMNELSQIEENGVICDRLPAAGTMTEAESACYDDIRDIYNSLVKVACTDCKYCQPCPQGVGIPSIFHRVNRMSMFNGGQEVVDSYKKMIEEGRGADKCVQCGYCETQCPQGVSIMAMLQESHAMFMGK